MHTPANLRQYPVSVPPFFDLFSSFFKNLFIKNKITHIMLMLTSFFTKDDSFQSKKKIVKSMALFYIFASLFNI